jgi:hypothetical protein
MGLKRGLLPGLAATLLAGVSVLGQEQKDENDARFHPLLLAAAKAYEGYGKVDDALRFAPTLCMAPPPQPVRLSASKDTGTHGQKLYYLYAWDAASYLKSSKKDWKKSWQTPPSYDQKPAEQVLVKQSWTRAPATKESEALAVGEMKDLFLMIKLAEKTEGTDKGWVYGTVTADGKRVTSSGRVASCMACHETAGDGRLFGLSRDGEKPKAK